MRIHFYLKQDSLPQAAKRNCCSTFLGEIIMLAIRKWLLTWLTVVKSSHDRRSGEHGISLIESLVALVIVSIIAVAILSALATSARANLIADRQTTAQSIARGHMEYIKNQEYSANSWAYTVSTTGRSTSWQPSWWDTSNPPLLPSMYDRYSVQASASYFDVDNDSTIEVPGDDEGIRKIIIYVYFQGESEAIITLEGYKVNL